MAFVLMIISIVCVVISVCVSCVGFVLFAKGVFNGNDNNKMFKYFMMFGGGNFSAFLFGIAAIGCAIWAGIANYHEIVNYFNM